MNGRTRTKVTQILKDMQKLDEKKLSGNNRGPLLLPQTHSYVQQINKSSNPMSSWIVRLHVYAPKPRILGQGRPMHTDTLLKDLCICKLHFIEFQLSQPQKKKKGTKKPPTVLLFL